MGFQSRHAILYKDGTAKLWSAQQKDPVAPPLRHKGPIRGLTFFDEANLLITISDESVKVWDALTGEPRKELEGQHISPLWKEFSFASGPKRFVTIAKDGKAVTIWDAASLNAIATLGPTGGERTAAGLSGDGRTVAVFRFGADVAVELWDVATGRSFATLRPPSPSVAEVFTGAGEGLHKSGVLREARLWEVVRSLAPPAADRQPPEDQKR